MHHVVACTKYLFISSCRQTSNAHVLVTSAAQPVTCLFLIDVAAVLQYTNASFIFGERLSLSLTHALLPPTLPSTMFRFWHTLSRRRYPQIYASEEKLLLDAKSVKVCRALRTKLTLNSGITDCRRQRSAPMGPSTLH